MEKGAEINPFPILFVIWDDRLGVAVWDSRLLWYVSPRRSADLWCDPVGEKGCEKISSNGLRRREKVRENVLSKQEELSKKEES